jgi:hypothetical protein
MAYKQKNNWSNLTGNGDGDPEQVYIAGQNISTSKKGNIYDADIDIHEGPSKGDVIHGANKYKRPDGNSFDDADYTYRPSTRKSSQNDNVKHWTITGTK